MTKVLIVSLMDLDGDSMATGAEALKSYIENYTDINSEIHIARTAYELLELPCHLKEFDVVGFSVPYQETYEVSLKLAQVVKKHNKSVKIVFGGNYATNVAKNIIKNRHDIVDYVVRFAGEEPFSAIVRGDSPETIPNLVYLDEHNNVKENDLSQKEFFGEILTKTSGPKVMLRSSRGCNNKPRCAFCSVATTSYNRLTPEQFIHQIKFHVENNSDLGEMVIVDDNFITDRSYLDKCAELFVKENIPERVFLNIYAIPNDFTSEIIPALKALQVERVIFGCDSGNEDILRSAGKKNTPKENIRAAKLACENDFSIMCSYIILWPGETLEQMLETLNNATIIRSFCNKKNIMLFPVFPLEVLPGSKYFEMLCERHPEYREMDNINPCSAANHFLRYYYENDKQYFEMQKHAVKIMKKIDKMTYRPK